MGKSHGLRFLFLLTFALVFTSLANGETNTALPIPATNAIPPLRILLLGDSTVAGTYPRMVAPQADHLEDVIRKLLAAEPDFPPTEVINRGVNGATVKSCLEHYDRWIGKLPGPCDYVFLRFGVNDVRSGTNFPTEFPVQYHELIERLRKDHPNALLTIESVIPYENADSIAKANEAVRKVAEAEKLPLLDIHDRFAKELELQGANALTYRFVEWKNIPEGKRSFIPESWRAFEGKWVIILDNTLDAHFRDVPRWFADRHPNLAGYHVIGDEIVRYLTPVIRERLAATRSK